MDCPKAPVARTKAEQARHDKALLGKPDCANCPYAVNGQPNKPVLGVGNTNAIGLLVIEAPHKDDVDSGEPLVGLLGQQFDYILAQKGLPRERLFIISAIACRPNGDRSDANMRAAATCCKPLFLSQLVKLNPDIPILAMGKLATFILTGKDLVFNGRGFLRPYRLANEF